MVVLEIFQKHKYLWPILRTGILEQVLNVKLNDVVNASEISIFDLNNHPYFKE
ncbi:hypothetical protein PACTADRAFT_5385 [Pachysolen tannophilus NRRL Y-2460]|uniref:Uncharacterized protein n=1 Tax=Pachysolen tannophilus NRRL Y-2460 TaxID=669874 RepID=A0A1E4TMV4_PACTA|nr:hypothetical protein PACTADRAFT_5385 [Pachysolen tannophilus NRRL Y-2460]